MQQSLKIFISLSGTILGFLKAETTEDESHSSQVLYHPISDIDSITIMAANSTNSRTAEVPKEDAKTPMIEAL